MPDLSQIPGTVTILAADQPAAVALAGPAVAAAPPGRLGLRSAPSADLPAAVAVALAVVCDAL